MRQLVAKHRSDFLMNAVQAAVEARKAAKNKRGSIMGSRKSLTGALPS